MTAKWKLLARPSAGGHRFFEHKATGRIAIADQSGGLPEYTDDGIIWMDDTKMATVPRRYGSFYGAPRLKLGNGDEVVISFADLVWIIEHRILTSHDVAVRFDSAAHVAASSAGLSRLLELLE